MTIAQIIQKMDYTTALEKASENNHVFVVYKGTEENTVIEHNVRYISYDDSFELGITGNGVKYKN